MCNPIAHPLLTHVQPIPELWKAAPSQLLPVYEMGMMSYGMELPLGQFVPAVLAMLPPGSLHTYPPAEHRKVKSLYLG